MSFPVSTTALSRQAPPRGKSPFAKVYPAVDSGKIWLEGGFLGGRAETNRRVSLLYGLEQLEAGGNIDNLRVAGGREGAYHPTLTLDADVHKWLEAVSFELGRAPDLELQAALDEIVAIVLQAQEADGYLNSWFQVEEPERKLTDLTRGCEMYCAGHFIQAGVALSRATGDRRLLDAAVKFADLLDERFGPQGKAGIDGHEEIELALVDLYRETGERRYLDLSARFIDERGHGLVGPGVFGPRYYQDHEPVRDADTITGHAVRAMYLNTGAADIYLEKGDPTLLAALERQWEAMVSTKIYLTGGLGSRERDEAIGESYELSPDRAYCETCAAAGLIFWNWKMLQATGNARYADLLERALYNAFLAGVSLDGRSYFYANPLEVREIHDAPHESEWSGETPWYISPAPEQATSHRRPWFRCACCPPNVMRVLSSLEQYIATTNEQGIQVQQYSNSKVSAELNSATIGVRISTDYPWDANIRVEITETREEPWELSLRVPDWAKGATVSIGGKSRPADPGYWSETRAWVKGEMVLLMLPLEARLTQPMPRSSAIYGSLAFERGPLVYCVEQADNPGVPLTDVRVSQRPELRVTDGPPLVPGLIALQTEARLAAPPIPGAWAYPSQPHGTERSSNAQTVPLTAIPYFAWANRGGNAMRVWLPVNLEGDGRPKG